jgi:hypothetical protein
VLVVRVLQHLAPCLKRHKSNGMKWVEQMGFALLLLSKCAAKRETSKKTGGRKESVVGNFIGTLREIWEMHKNGANFLTTGTLHAHDTSIDSYYYRLSINVSCAWRVPVWGMFCGTPKTTKNRDKCEDIVCARAFSCRREP